MPQKVNYTRNHGWGFGLWHLSPAPGVERGGSWPPPLLPQIQIDGSKMKLVFLKNKKNWVVFLNFYLYGKPRISSILPTGSYKQCPALVLPGFQVVFQFNFCAHIEINLPLLGRIAYITRCL